MGKDTPVSRRKLFNELVKRAVRLAREGRAIEEEIREEPLLSFESLPILHTYPWELFEEEAKRMGIDVDKVGKNEAIRLIVAKSCWADRSGGNADKAPS